MRIIKNILGILKDVFYTIFGLAFVIIAIPVVFLLCLILRLKCAKCGSRIGVEHVGCYVADAFKVHHYHCRVCNYYWDVRIDKRVKKCHTL